MTHFQSGLGVKFPLEGVSMILQLRKYANDNNFEFFNEYDRWWQVVVRNGMFQVQFELLRRDQTQVDCMFTQLCYPNLSHYAADISKYDHMIPIEDVTRFLTQSSVDDILLQKHWRDMNQVVKETTEFLKHFADVNKYTLNNENKVRICLQVPRPDQPPGHDCKQVVFALCNQEPYVKDISFIHNHVFRRDFRGNAQIHSSEILRFTAHTKHKAGLDYATMQIVEDFFKKSWDANELYEFGLTHN
jgi:hypothetical protein